MPQSYEDATRIARRLFRSLSVESVEDIVQEGYAAFLRCGSDTRKALMRSLITAFRGLSYRGKHRTIPIEHMVRAETQAFNDWPVADATSNGYRYQSLAYDSSIVSTDNGQATVDMADLIASMVPAEGRRREVVILRVLGLCYHEIGERLGIAEEAARSIWRRERDRLREAWKPES